jgi:hypothetical protein
MTKTTAEIGELLEERGLSMTIWYGRTMAEAKFTVWLFAADDPELGIFPGSAEELGGAIDAAIAEWDQIPAADAKDDKSETEESN